MRPTNLRWAAAALVAAGTLNLAAPPAAAAPAAADASSIRPLLVGAAIPAVSVRDAANNAVDLHALSARQPTVLIFYRGGW